MTPERARELLGGLAAGILTPEERQTLFEAALHDQMLFNEVADELEFAAFLQSPETRAQLANRIEVEPERRKWWTLRPAWLALSGVLAASIVLFVAIRQRPSELAHLSVNETLHPKTTVSATPPAESVNTESAKAEAVKKDAAQAAGKAASAPKTSATPKEPSGALPAQLSKDSAAENRLERRDRRQAEPAAPGSRPIVAAPFAPMAAPPHPAPQPQQSPMARVLADRAADVTILSGAVHDPTGAAVSNAKVDVVNTATNATFHAATDAGGRFQFLALPQGPYTVTTNAAGFVAERKSVTVAVNQPAQIDIPLRPGDMAETVNVTAAAPALSIIQNQTQSQNQTQVAVLDFANGNQPGQSGAQTADQLSSQLLSTGQFRVIDREKVQQAAQSQNAAGRPSNTQEAAALGRSIGADAVILGSIQAPNYAGTGVVGGLAKSKPAPNVSVTADIIDTKKAKPVMKVSADAASLQRATNILGTKIQSRLSRPVEGKITRQSGDIVSVTFVETPGLQPGARCDVIHGTRKIGELVITSVNGLSAFGKFTGTSQPGVGDRVTSYR
jgi:curli biogenesis system outer membrane secretion channel CsgG